MACHFRLATAINNHKVISLYMCIIPVWWGGKALQNIEIIPTRVQQ